MIFIGYFFDKIFDEWGKSYFDEWGKSHSYSLFHFLMNGINPIPIHYNCPHELPPALAPHELPPALAGGKLFVNEFLHEWNFF